MKYRKRPVVIDAIQFKGAENMSEVNAFMNGDGGFMAWPERVVVPTLEGDMIGNFGDYVIRGIKGELYPCRADIFDATYELVGD